MHHRTGSMTLLWAGALALGLATGAAAQDADAEPATTTVREGAFTAELSTQGHYIAESRADVVVDFEAYAGKLEVEQVLVEQGRVSRGEPLVRLAAPDLSEQLEDARRSLKQAERALAWAEQERTIGEAEAGIAAERRALSWADMEADFKRWSSFGKADALLSEKLTMQQTEARVADEQEELDQLEKLYADAKLATRTQDIVLERAKRRLAVSKQRLAIAERNHKVMLDVVLPRRDRDRKNAQRWMEAEHEHAVQRAGVARTKRELAVQDAERALAKAKQKVADLEADAASLVVEAPAAGVLTGITLKPGERLQNQQTLAAIDDAKQGTLKTKIAANALRFVQVGDAVRVNWRAFGEVESKGTVQRIAWQGEAAADGQTHYAVTIQLEDVDGRIRPGMLADIQFSEQLAEPALIVPIESVGQSADGHYCMVKVGNRFEQRDVVIGAMNDEQVQIVRGLKAGETIRLIAE